MNIDTTLYNQLLSLKETQRAKGIEKLASMMKQTTRFSNFTEEQLVQLATRAWDGEFNLKKEMA